jgi:hypothetical protein
MVRHKDVMRGVQDPLFLVLKPFKLFRNLSEKSPVLDKYHVPYFNEDHTVSLIDRVKE